MSYENDLDLKNYQLFDILGLFELPYDYTDNHVDNAKEKTKNIETQVKDKEIVKFYKKAFIIISSLRKIIGTFHRKFQISIATPFFFIIYDLCLCLSLGLVQARPLLSI